MTSDLKMLCKFFYGSGGAYHQDWCPEDEVEEEMISGVLERFECEWDRIDIQRLDDELAALQKRHLTQNELEDLLTNLYCAVRPSDDLNSWLVFMRRFLRNNYLNRIKL